jgi:disulfide bond formation protein DsbB
LSLRDEFHSNYQNRFFEQVWQLSPRQFKRCFTILLMLKRGLGQEFGGSVMAPQSDTSSLYVLACSMAGTIVGLAATWIVVAHTFVQPMVA